MSAEEREAKDKRNKKIIVIVLGLIMLLSSLSYAFLSFEGDNSNGGSSVVDTLTYNGIKFSKTNYGTWKFSASGSNFETKYSPEETLNISVILTKNIQSYSNQPLYFGIDNLEQLETAGNSEIVTNIGNLLLKYQSSCLTTNCTENVPIKNCATDNVIIFQKSDKTSVIEDEKCVYIKYNSGEAIRATDAFLFKILSVR